MPAVPSIYQILIYKPEDWDQLVERKLDIVVDPFVFRIGQLFLQGREAGRDTWDAIQSDLGALVTFFDLIVLHDMLPAFNYYDTFDFPDGRDFGDFNDGLRAVVNADGDETLVHVDVEHGMYRQTKAAALDQLARHIDDGPLVPPNTAKEILAALDAVRYMWTPNLETLADRFDDDRQQKLARFLLGQLVFAGYAQQTGAPHALAPRRSTFVARAGLRGWLPDGAPESAVFQELGRRIRLAGEGWRIEEQAWTPSFLPLLLRHFDPVKEGPDVLLRRAKELRETKSVRHYRDLRSALVGDAPASAKARGDLTKAADRVARELRADRNDLELTRRVAVAVLPEALGAAAGTAVGVAAGVPELAVAGALAGPFVEAALSEVNKRVWGLAVDRLPFRSARKLLSRSVWAEIELRERLGRDLKTAWETGRR